MVSFTSLMLVLSTTIGVFALPHSPPEGNANALFPRQTPGSKGYHDGWYYMFWTDGQGQHNYTNLPGGRYNVSWAGSRGNFFGGKGWDTGKFNRTIRYSGTYAPSGNSYLSVYGYMKDPLIEYYIMDNYGSYNPGSGGVYKGTVETDGSIYRISQTTRYPQNFEPTLYTYYSIRDRKRASGTITLKNHFDAFASFGMKLGTFDGGQIMAVEGYYSSGTAQITVYPESE